MKRWFVLFFGIVACSAGVYPAASETVDVAAIISGVEKQAAKIKTLKGRIVKEIIFKEQPVEMVGNFYYRYPAHLRIEYATPVEQVVVTDGKTLRVYIPAEKKLISQALESMPVSEQSRLGTAEGFGLNPFALLKGYDFSFKWKGKVKDCETVVIRAENEGSAVKSLIWIDTSRSMLLRLESYLGDYEENNFMGRTQVHGFLNPAPGCWFPESSSVLFFTSGGAVKINTKFSRLRVNEEITEDMFDLRMDSPEAAVK